MSTWDQIKKGASSVKGTAVSAGSKGKAYLDKDKVAEPYRRDPDAPRPVFGDHCDQRRVDLCTAAKEECIGGK